MQLGIEANSAAAKVEALRREVRRDRFEASARACPPAATTCLTFSDQQPALDAPVVGLSTQIFRPFFRLRSAPDPNTVRPEKVLQESLRQLLDSRTAPAGGWEQVREQLWSIRQDLLVQHLHHSKLAASVGLEGARLSIQAGDVAELHRCLAALIGPCASRMSRWPSSTRQEVMAFRLMYLTHGGLEGRPGRLEGELLEFFKKHLPSLKAAGPALAFAHRIHTARVAGNWTRHLRLAGNAEGSGAVEHCTRLAGVLTPSVRKNGLVALTRAFPHGICARRAARMLALDGAGLLEVWLKHELGFEACISNSRLNCATVAAKLADEQQAAEEGSGNVKRNGFLASKHASNDAAIDEAPIWRELSGSNLKTFASKHAMILQRMVENKAKKKQSKQEKKRDKKAMKKEKKKLKKAKKKLKKEKKKLKKSMKKEKKSNAANVAPVTCASSSSSSENSPALVPARKRPADSAASAVFSSTSGSSLGASSSEEDP